jgi:hypothetical protein
LISQGTFLLALRVTSMDSHRRAAVWITTTALVLGAWALVHPVSGPSGDIAAVGRDSADLGGHVVAVLDAGTRIRFDVVTRPVFGETVHVGQPAGRVLYRVDDGARLVIRTPHGEVEARGTALMVDASSVPASSPALSETSNVADAAVFAAFDKRAPAGADDLSALRLRSAALHEELARHCAERPRAAVAEDDPCAAADRP